MRRAFYVVLALAMLLSISASVMAGTRFDSKTIALDVNIGPWAEIEISNPNISLVLAKPGESKYGTTPFTVKTNTDVIVTFADYFPRLTLQNDTMWRSFKDPGEPEWSNALKSKVWIAKNSNGVAWDHGIEGASHLGENMPVTRGTKISRWVTLNAHWDNGEVVDPGWWHAIAGSYTGTVVLIVEPAPES
jgi:hypothetical protein